MLVIIFKTCGAARRKRRDVDGRIPTRTVSFGPIRKLDITLYEGENGYVETFVNNITLDKMYDRRLGKMPSTFLNSDCLFWDTTYFVYYVTSGNASTLYACLLKNCRW